MKVEGACRGLWRPKKDELQVMLVTVMLMTTMTITDWMITVMRRC